MVFDPLLAALEHSRTTLCCVRCGKTVQNGLFVKHILWSQSTDEQKHYCPFLKKMLDKPENKTISVPRWDTSQSLFPDEKKGGDRSGKASAKKKKEKTEKRGGDVSGEASAKKKQKTEKK